MKINIQKIAYRAIPVLTAFVILVSCVVVGNPTKASAGGIYDFSTDYSLAASATPFDKAYYKLTPRPQARVFYVGSDAPVVYNWEQDEKGYLSAHTSFSIYLDFEGKFYRSDCGNRIEFYDVDWFSYDVSHDGIWTSYSLDIDYMSLDFYDNNGNWISAQHILYENGVYADMIHWPSNASYFTCSLARYYAGGTNGAYIRFYFWNYDLDLSVNLGFSTYNIGKSGPMYYYWKLSRNVRGMDSDYAYILADLMTELPFYSLTWHNSNTKKRNVAEIWGTEFSFSFEPGDSLSIVYDSTAVFDVREFLAVSAHVVVDDVKSAYANYGDGDTAFTPPVFVVSYYDIFSRFLGAQEISCSCSSDDWLHTHSYDFNFAYPSNVRYLRFGLKWNFSSDTDVTLLIGFDSFYMEFYRNQALFDDYFNPVFTPTPGIDNAGIGALVDEDALHAFSSVFERLWSCTVLNAILIIVVSLALVSWVFFGKK